MDPKHLMLAHGEKAVVLIVAGLCAWKLIAVFTNDEIRPGTTQQATSDRIAVIAKVMDSKDVPSLKAPPTYLEDMKARFNRELPRAVRPSWIFSHTDIGGGASGTFYYIYELNAPAVVPKDNIGTIEVVVSPPKVGTGSERRSSEWEKQWTRTTEKTILNSAKVAGVQVEMKVGEGQWRPLKAPGVLAEGFIPLETLKKSEKFTFPTQAVWERHYFRARTILKATGYTGEDKDADETVLVHNGQIDEPDWKIFGEQMKASPEMLTNEFMAGAKQAVPGVDLKKGELLYYSNDCDIAWINATSDIRFAFEKSLTDPSDPSKESASVLLSKQFKRPTGNVWLDKPEVFKVEKDDVIGGKRNLKPPGEDKLKEVDLTTPFQLVDIKHGIERIWYYEVKAKARTDGAKGKELYFEPVKKQTDVAVLKNSKTGVVVEMTKLAKITKPNRSLTGKTFPVFYPMFPGDFYDEEDEFRKSPSEFQQWGLIPPTPIMHDKDTGPLEDLRLNPPGNGVYKTDTAYIELPDGRLIWWEPINKEIAIYPEPKADAKGPALPPPRLNGPKNGPKAVTPPKTPKAVAPPRQPPPGAYPPGAGGPPPGAGGPPPGAGGYPQGGPNGGGAAPRHP